MQSLIIGVLWLLSDLESYFTKFPSFSLLRRLYLKLKKVNFKKHIWIGHNVNILNGKNLSVGDYCAIGHNAIISDHTNITIGDNFTGSNGLCLNSGSHDNITYKPFAKDIIIGNRVWIGLNVTIINGVKIGDDVIVGAGSLVNKDIPSKSIAVGVPVKVIKKLKRDDLQEYYKWARW
jgi:maltose O-acetyltransferase